MEQTSLNLVAIAVFLMTLSALLSPVLHISPFIPAGTTLGILTLATLDSVSWGGRGLNIFLDFFASSQQRQRVIHHEAGHFLAAYCLGIPITGYTLSAWEAFKQGQPGLGGVQFDLTLLSDTKTIQKTPLILERTLTVLMAGIAAEMMIYDNVEGGEEDKKNLRYIMRIMGIPNSLYQQKESWALLQAKNLITRNQTAYDALIEMMEKRASLEACQSLIHEKLNQIEVIT
ncbi:hypothetical protein VB715_19175 [Crocosphaera sp. UHCC 0190]|uniref:hypothetical protein n=1 Tax=Crocosphaera sp. UHCC 0190 TaxID=3110246 RepID=UPI002B21DDDC|nr:hypothetical protein [Crocosphaera sp. UHCC 0190]MEA5511899.1 hypothetical protein [Crocosphaera sp. UHCC 0190]